MVAFEQSETVMTYLWAADDFAETGAFLFSRQPEEQHRIPDDQRHGDHVRRQRPEKRLRSQKRRLYFWK